MKRLRKTSSRTVWHAGRVAILVFIEQNEKGGTKRLGYIFLGFYKVDLSIAIVDL